MSAATVETTDAIAVARFPKTGTAALLLSRVGVVDPELLDTEGIVTETVLFEEGLGELVLSVAGVVDEDVADKVTLLTNVVEAVAVAVTREDSVSDELKYDPSMRPTE